MNAVAQFINQVPLGIAAAAVWTFSAAVNDGYIGQSIPEAPVPDPQEVFQTVNHYIPVLFFQEPNAPPSSIISPMSNATLNTTNEFTILPSVIAKPIIPVFACWYAFFFCIALFVVLCTRHCYRNLDIVQEPVVEETVVDSRARVKDYVEEDECIRPTNEADLWKTVQRVMGAKRWCVEEMDDFLQSLLEEKSEEQVSLLARSAITLRAYGSGLIRRVFQPKSLPDDSSREEQRVKCLARYDYVALVGVAAQDYGTAAHNIFQKQPNKAIRIVHPQTGEQVTAQAGPLLLPQAAVEQATNVEYLDENVAEGPANDVQAWNPIAPAVKSIHDINSNEHDTQEPQNPGDDGDSSNADKEDQTDTDTDSDDSEVVIIVDKPSPAEDDRTSVARATISTVSHIGQPGPVDNGYAPTNSAAEVDDGMGDEFDDEFDDEMDEDARQDFLEFLETLPAEPRQQQSGEIQMLAQESFPKPSERLGSITREKVTNTQATSSNDGQPSVDNAHQPQRSLSAYGIENFTPLGSGYNSPTFAPGSDDTRLSFGSAAYLCPPYDKAPAPVQQGSYQPFHPPQQQLSFPALQYGRGQSFSTRSSVSIDSRPRERNSGYRRGQGDTIAGLNRPKEPSTAISTSSAPSTPTSKESLNVEQFDAYFQEQEKRWINSGLTKERIIRLGILYYQRAGRVHPTERQEHKSSVEAPVTTPVIKDPGQESDSTSTTSPRPAAQELQTAANSTAAVGMGNPAMELSTTEDYVSGASTTAEQDDVAQVRESFTLEGPVPGISNLASQYESLTQGATPVDTEVQYYAQVPALKEQATDAGASPGPLPEGAPNSGAEKQIQESAKDRIVETAQPEQRAVQPPSTFQPSVAAPASQASPAASNVGRESVTVIPTRCPQGLEASIHAVGPVPTGFRNWGLEASMHAGNSISIGLRNQEGHRGQRGRGRGRGQGRGRGGHGGGVRGN